MANIPRRYTLLTGGKLNSNAKNYEKSKKDLDCMVYTFYIEGYDIHTYRQYIIHTIILYLCHADKPSTNAQESVWFYNVKLHFHSSFPEFTHLCMQNGM